MFRTRPGKALVLALLCAGAASLRALEVYSTQVFTIDPEDPAWSYAIQVAQYDGLYPLAGIEFDITGTLSGSYAVRNNDSQPVTIEFYYSTTIYLSRQSGDTGEGQLIASATPRYLEEQVFGTSPEWHTLDVNVSDDAAHTSPPPSSDLAAFTGTGTVTLYIWALSETSLVTPESGKEPPDVILSDPLAGATVTIRYLIVPEPGPLVLLALLGLPVALLRRGRRPGGGQVSLLGAA